MTPARWTAQDLDRGDGEHEDPPETIAAPPADAARLARDGGFACPACGRALHRPDCRPTWARPGCTCA